jgi:hypothetical protein
MDTSYEQQRRSHGSTPLHSSSNRRPIFQPGILRTSRALCSDTQCVKTESVRIHPEQGSQVRSTTPVSQTHINAERIFEARPTLLPLSIIGSGAVCQRQWMMKCCKKDVKAHFRWCGPGSRYSGWPYKLRGCLQQSVIIPLPDSSFHR